MKAPLSSSVGVQETSAAPQKKKEREHRDHHRKEEHRMKEKGAKKDALDLGAKKNRWKKKKNETCTVIGPQKVALLLVERAGRAGMRGDERNKKRKWEKVRARP